MKAHKVTHETYRAASKFRVVYGFWNPVVTAIKTECGTDPNLITFKWNKTTCKRCLAKKRAAIARRRR